MSRITKALLIAAVAVMLVAATSASAYYERWEGWFNSGHLFYGDDTYDYVEGEGVLEDRTYGSVDSFFVSAVCISTFSCTEKGWTIKLWPGASGYKYTGQSEQKQVEDGAWTGFARLYRPELPDVEFTVGGTWNTTDEPGDCFNYWGRPYIYSAHWVLSESDPLDLRGAGGSAGERIYYSP